MTRTRTDPRVATYPDGVWRALLVVAVLDGCDGGFVRAVMDDVGCTQTDRDGALASGLLTTPEAHSESPWSYGEAGVRDSVLEQVDPALMRLIRRAAVDEGLRLGIDPAVTLPILTELAVDDVGAVDDLAALAAAVSEGPEEQLAAEAWEEAARASDDPVRRHDLAMHAVKQRVELSTTAAGTRRLLSFLRGLPLDDSEVGWIALLNAGEISKADLPAAREALQAVRGHAAELDPASVPELLSELATIAWELGDAEGELEFARARKRYEAGGSSGVPWAGDALMFRALCDVGDLAEGWQYRDVGMWASAEADLTSSAPLHQLLEAVAFDEMLCAEGETTAERLAGALRRTPREASRHVAFLNCIAADHAIREGRYASATARLDAADMARDADDLWLALVVASVRCDVAWRTLPRPEVLRVTAETRTLCDRIGGRRRARWADYADAMLDVAEGRPESALVHLEALLRGGSGGRAVHDLPTRARLELVGCLDQVGAHDDAGVELAVVLGDCAGVSDDLTRAWLDRAVAGHESALSDLQAVMNMGRALRRFKGWGDPFEVARTQFALGKMMTARDYSIDLSARRTIDLSASGAGGQGRVAGRGVGLHGAAAELTAAAFGFRRIGAVPWAKAAEDALRVATAESLPESVLLPERASPPELRLGGAVRGPTGVVPLGGAVHLTRQEAKVARMAAEGMRNKEIAEALFLSTRTVEFHLASAFRKLGISRRADLRAHFSG